MSRPTLTLGENADAIMRERKFKLERRAEKKKHAEKHAERERRMRDLQKQNEPHDNSLTNYLRVHRTGGVKNKQA